MFSQVSLFGITIKQTVGKLPGLYATVSEIYAQAIKDNFTFLSITNEHIFRYNTIPLNGNHRDPFDSLLIATAVEENAVVLSADNKFNLYPDLLTVYW